MLKKILYYVTTILCSAFITTSFAATTPELSSAADAIKNLHQTTCQIKRHSPLPALFLTQIPPTKDTQKLFASYTSYGVNPDYNKYWQINFDSTAECQGTHVCNVGSVSAEKDGKLETTYQPDMKSKLIPKQKVVLKNQVTAYFTPFHSLGSSFDPSLEWQDNHVLYKIQWRIEQDQDAKKILVDMANSAIKVYRTASDTNPIHTPPPSAPQSNAAE